MGIRRSWSDCHTRLEISEITFYLEHIRRPKKMIFNRQVCITLVLIFVSIHGAFQSPALFLSNNVESRSGKAYAPAFDSIPECCSQFSLTGSENGTKIAWPCVYTRDGVQGCTGGSEKTFQEWLTVCLNFDGICIQNLYFETREEGETGDDCSDNNKPDMTDFCDHYKAEDWFAEYCSNEKASTFFGTNENGRGHTLMDICRKSCGGC